MILSVKKSPGQNGEGVRKEGTGWPEGILGMEIIMGAESREEGRQ